MRKFGSVLVSKEYEDKELAGRVYRVTGQTEDSYTIEDGWLGECYTVPKSMCKILEDKSEQKGISVN